jgi:hypothetical protein
MRDSEIIIGKAVDVPEDGDVLGPIDKCGRGLAAARAELRVGTGCWCVARPSRGCGCRCAVSAAPMVAVRSALIIVWQLVPDRGADTITDIRGIERV